MPAERILLAVIGSQGDIAPMLALAQALQTRGAEVHVLANPAATPAFQAIGLEAQPIGDPQTIAELLAQQPAYMGLRGGQLVLRDIARPCIPLFHQATQQAIATIRPTRIVSHVLPIGTRVAARQAGIHSTVVHLSPLTWLNWRDLDHYRPLTRRCIRSMAPLIDQQLARMMRDPLRAIGCRDAVDFRHCFLDADRCLGLWSPHFRCPRPGDPVHAVICGTARPTSDGAPLPPELQAYLDSGPAPVIVALGSTAIHVAQHLFPRISLACRALGRRCLQVGGQAVAGADPTWYRAVTQADHSLLFPHAACAIIHGGIGTSLAALRAGCPVVVLPFAHDQFDNAARLRALGCATTRWQRLTSSSRIAELIATACQAERRAAASALAQRMREEPSGADRAAAIILDQGTTR
jgi:UDP:flavonoid glycosyltransferase YjiC (YdhE family)